MTAIPPRAAEQLRRLIAERDRADQAIAAAISLVLASMELPLDAQIRVMPDGGMVAELPRPPKENDE